ncbi:MAG: DNA mismatch repair protein MutS [Victivallales bacterium]|nr:DNA mismatch repair protein MutS [Victivallales bacterium]
MPNAPDLTPAMRQYVEAHKGLPDKTILFFRMGDFYELFFEDAKLAAPMMDIVLTKRAGAPLCGVPYHALKTYVAIVLNAGYKVAIAEQLEDPKLAKGIVKRDVTQIITPGTLLEDTLLQSGQSNFLTSLCPGPRDLFGLAVMDLSTGDFRVTELTGLAALETEFNRLEPAECLAPDSAHRQWTATGFPPAPQQMLWTPADDWTFDLEIARDNLCRLFGVASLDGFGCRGLTVAVQAAGALFHYVSNNLRRDVTHVTSLQCYNTGDCLTIDRISQRNLELVEPIFADGKGNTLISVLDHTITPMGARLLREWILRPLRSKPLIESRLDAVQELVQGQMTLCEIRELLGRVRDLERVIARLNLGTANARDLTVLSAGLAEIPGLRSVIATLTASPFASLAGQLRDLPEVTGLIDRAIVDEPPLAIKEGGLIRTGYNASLDELRRASTEGKDWIAQYQSREVERTGIKSLKVRYTKVFGYFIEVTNAFLDKVPADYMRKQTLVGAERFITPELKEIEDKVIGADEKSMALEYELFQELRAAICTHTHAIQENARALAQLDCLCSLAEAAIRQNYTRPAISESPVLEIRDGRHPVLEARMVNETFVPNDTFLDAQGGQLNIITGPNMAGKSTYIRQVALLTLMAQMGSFIPATSATIGLTDRIFTRVGAADDLSRGQSTFMVEMVETANILNHATPQSLIVLDEIGRGTSTFDGLSLAWAIAEYLHDNQKVKARTLFATHYHELTDLAVTRPGVRNYNVLVTENGDQIAFTRKIVPGAADKSYGINVAKLAGLPKDVLTRAAEVLANLENDELSDEGKPRLARLKRKRSKENPGQLMLFDL